MTAGVIVAILAILGIDPLVGVFGSMAGVATVGMVPLMLTNFTLVTGGSTVLAAIPFAGLLVGACCGGRHNRCRIPGPAEIRHPATRMLRGSRLAESLLVERLPKRRSAERVGALAMVGS